MVDANCQSKIRIKAVEGRETPHRQAIEDQVRTYKGYPLWFFT